MSRIGFAPITIPNNVELTIDRQNVTVKGPKGELSVRVNPDINVAQEDGTVKVTRPSDHRKHRSLHGLTRTLIANMVTGVTDGFTKQLQIQGVGYRAAMDNTTLVLTVGYSHPVRVQPVEGISFSVENNTQVNVSGIDKELVGEVAARIRRIRPPEPYKGKGIRYQGEQIRRKAGKAGKVGV